jgi:hypothetical protein
MRTSKAGTIFSKSTDCSGRWERRLVRVFCAGMMAFIALVFTMAAILRSLEGRVNVGLRRFGLAFGEKLVTEATWTEQFLYTIAAPVA